VNKIRRRKVDPGQIAKKKIIIMREIPLNQENLIKDHRTNPSTKIKNLKLTTRKHSQQLQLLLLKE